MLASVVFVPSAPLLVPALAGPGAGDTVAVREATRQAAQRLAAVASHWIAVGVGDTGNEDGTAQDWSTSGSFAGYGVDVGVSLGGSADGRALPLSMLIAGWLRGEVGAGAVTPVVVGADAPAIDCVRLGHALRTRIDAAAEPIGVLVVGDGAISLAPKAPGGGLDPESVELQTHIDSAIGDGDVAALRSLDQGLCTRLGVSGRAAWQMACGIVGTDRASSEMIYAAAPFGVGYVVARWSVR